MSSGLHVFVCDHEEEGRGGTNKPLSTGTPRTHKGIPLGEVLHTSAHIPPLLLPETWMIWLFDDSLSLNLFGHHMCVMWGLPVMWMPRPGVYERPEQFSNLEGGSACELRRAYSMQMCIGLDSSACSRKRLPVAMHLAFYHSPFSVRN